MSAVVDRRPPEPSTPPRHVAGLGRLQSRLFFWLIGSIILALGSAVAASQLITPSEPSARPAQVMARTIAATLDRQWETPAACDDYIARMRTSTGFDLRLRRDVDNLPPVVHRTFKRGGALAFDASEGAFIVVVHGGAVVGAVQFESSAPRAPWWRLAAGLTAALLVMGAMARSVSRRLSLPLERVAQAAERLGAGDLGARAQVGEGPAHWVADEVGELSRAFDAMAGRIQQVVNDQRELLAAISHELRSPLGRARVALEIARDRVAAGEVLDPRGGGAPPPSAALVSLDQVERELGAVDAVLGDLFAVTRAGLSDLRTRKTEIVPWLRERMVREPASPPIELSVEVTDPVAVIDAELLGRAVHNILENARVHGHPPSSPLVLTVRASPSDPRRLAVAVRDHGPGFAAELLPRAFDPFVRGDAARSRVRGGSGLGLALVRRIAEAHRGDAFARNIVVNGKVTGAEVGVEIDAGLER